MEKGVKNKRKKEKVCFHFGVGDRTELFLFVHHQARLGGRALLAFPNLTPIDWSFDRTIDPFPLYRSWLSRTIYLRLFRALLPGMSGRDTRSMGIVSKLPRSPRDCGFGT